MICVFCNAEVLKQQYADGFYYQVLHKKNCYISLIAERRSFVVSKRMMKRLEKLVKEVRDV